MKKRLFVAVVSILLLVGFSLPSPVLGVSAGLFASPVPAGPANDNFADALVIDGLPFSHSLDTSTASLERREPTPSCAQGTAWGSSVWYAYTPAEDSSVTARGDAWPSTGLAVYTGRSLNSLTEVGSHCWGGRFTFRAEASTTYYIQVGGMEGYGGWLNFYLEGAPPNDDWINAQLISQVPYSHSMDTSTAGLEVDEPTPGCAQGSSWGKSVWYAYTPTQSGSVTVRTDVWFYGLAAYTGTSLGELSPIGSRCSGERLTFRAEAGTTYYFQVGDMSGYGGWLSLYLDGGPPNDDLANANSFSDSDLPYSHSMDTSMAGLETGEPTPGCAQWSSWGRSVWYAYTPDRSGSVAVRIETGFPIGLAWYTGDSLTSLTEVGSRCWNWSEQVTFRVEAGTIYYFQVGDMYGSGGWLNFHLEGAPPNDDFANAEPISDSDLPFSHSMSSLAASLESGEPTPGCAWDSWGKSVWYAYSPTVSGSVSAYVNAWFSPALAAYSGDSLSTLTEIGSRCWGGRLTFHAEAGTTYYFQVAAIYGDGGWFEFFLEVAPPPVAGIGFWPYDPSVFDTISFYSNSWDPAEVGIASCAWDLGDGTTSTDWSLSHQYAADGDYTVQLTVTTYDGRTASTSQTVSVRTHDVAITKFAVPTSARVGQTRAIVVGVNSKRYLEEVEVQLEKSVPGGYQWVGTLRQTVPVRPANRTTDFSFSYTFTADDARIGKVTFRATATILGARDALPADNEAISMPVKVTR